jgi:phosphoenolpyruvate carboxykinase (ATP)
MQKVVHNPTPDELRMMAIKDERTTKYGSASYITKVRSRSAKYTKNRIDDGFNDEDVLIIERMKEYLRGREIICIDRRMGVHSTFRLNCRLYVTKDYARLAYAWGELLTPIEEDDPDLTTVMIPEWEERKVLVDPEAGITYALGTDYIGEVKKSFLRMWMYEAKKRGGLGLHAGSKRVITRNSSIKREVGQLFFGLSATGKSTLTCHDLNLDGGERCELYQDDVVAILPDGTCVGAEAEGIFTKTHALNRIEQSALYEAVTKPNAILENVWVGGDGDVDFYNTELTSNGRAVIKRSEIHMASKSIDLPSVNQMFFITRNPLIPPIVRLSKEQAAAAFMLGESVESSAGDPSKAGQRIRVVGTNPFIVGSRAEEGNRFLEILRKNPDISCFILNTGEVGERDIKIQDTVLILRAVSRGNVTWEYDPILGYEISKSIKGIDIREYDPRKYYTPKEFEEKMKELRMERIEWLNQFSGLDADILNAV